MWLSSRSQKGPFPQADSGSRVSASPSIVVNEKLHSPHWHRIGLRQWLTSDIASAVDEPEKPDPALKIALAWQPSATRSALAALFALDRRLARMVSQAREPLLAQMRFAWWRDRLSQDDGVSRHGGEPLLDLIEAHWGARARQLGQLIDGWENLLGEVPLSVETIDAFADGRGAALAAFADLAGARADGASAFAAGRGWALADFASSSSDSRERDSAKLLGTQIHFVSFRSRSLRGVAVLGGLARRALERGEPLLHDRGAVLHAIRLGMFGR
jgi:phytoene synthase